MLKHKATVWRAAPHLESYIDQPFEKYSFVSTRALLHSAKDVQIGTPRRSLGRLNAMKQGERILPPGKWRSTTITVESGGWAAKKAGSVSKDVKTLAASR